MEILNNKRKSLAEESKIDSSLPLRMTGECHCEECNSTTWQSNKIKKDTTHSFFLFDFDAKRNKRTGGAEEKKKNTIPAEGLHNAQIEVGRKAAFTLAETLIVLVILGTIAAIVVPALIRNHIESTNRTKLKKITTVYDTGLSKFVIENQLKSEDAVYNAAPIGDCTLTSQFFKAVEYAKDESGNDDLCRFKTADNMWLDISDILAPKVAFKEEDLDNLNNATTFRMFSSFDENGNLRINDINYDDSKKHVAKIYNYILNKKTEPTQKQGYTSCYSIKKANADLKVCYKYDSNGNKTTEGYGCTGNDINSCLEYQCNIYDRNGNQTASGYDCTGSDISSCSGKQYYTYDRNGNQTAYGYDCTGSDISSCPSKNYYTYDRNGNQTVYGYDCTGSDINSCNYVGKYAYTYDRNGNKMAYGFNCAGSDISSCSNKYYYFYDKNGNKTGSGSYCTGSDISSCADKTYYTYDRNGNQTGYGQNCTGSDISSCKYKEYYAYDESGNQTAFGNNCTGSDISSCSNKSYYTYNQNGNKTAEGGGCTGNDISSCRDKYYYTYDKNGNQTAEGNNCTGSDINSCSSVTNYTITYDD